MKAHPVSVFSKTLVLTLGLLAMAAPDLLSLNSVAITNNAPRPSPLS